MPPADAAQPSESQRELLAAWYQEKFVDDVDARPSELRPRRLSAVEYRNTLRSLFGFDLEIAIIEAEQTVVEKSLVLKLLPPDPPGRSGFTNDTHANPLTTVIWDQYSYLVDSALEELFSSARKKELETLAGASLNGDFSHSDANQLLTRFLPRALRTQPDAERLHQIQHRIIGASDPTEATKRELKAVLMSAAFLYRSLLIQGEPETQVQVNDFELAQRLSYFLWADMPDDELLALASQKELQKPEIFRRQVSRMLDSPKSKSLAEDFAFQWLALGDIEQVSNETPYLAAIKSQPMEFINYLFTEDRPLLEIIDSDVTFANPLLRKFYGKDLAQLPKYKKPKGIEVEIVPLRKIHLVDTQGRGGLLTMPGVVAMNRGPIIRGTWMLERILGDELPDPPANVGQVQPNQDGQTLTFRERFQQHRENATCALCHDKIDPLGFALQAYDAAGAFKHSATYKPPRKRKDPSHDSDADIDASGELPSGEKFENFEQLKQILITTQRRKIVHNIVQRLLSYALCRELEYYDRPTVELIVDRVQENGTYRQLVHEIVNSIPFRETIIPGEEL